MCDETYLVKQMANNALGEHTGHARNEQTILHVLTGNVQRHVLRVDNTAYEAEVLGQETLALGLDKHLARVERDARLHATHAELLHMALREVEKSIDLNGSISHKVHAVGGGVVSTGEVAVKLVVLLLGDLVLGHGPNGLDSVETLAVEVDREADKVRVLLDDSVNLVRD